MEPELRFLRSADSLRPTKREHLTNFRHLGCRPSQLELFLDSPSFDGYPRAAYRWYIK